MRDLVIHAPTGLLLDFAEDDFGGEQQAAVIAKWQQRRHAEKGEFICYAHRDREQPQLYLAQHGSRIIAAHWPGSNSGGGHTITHGVSPEHMRQVEYISRASERAGFAVKPEVSLPTGVRSDAVIYGPTVTGVEVQRSKITAQEAKRRTTLARRAGVTPIWFSDSNADPRWIFKVPGVRMNEQAWNTVPRIGSVTVVSGVRVIVPKRCSDMRDSQCPNRRYGCNQWHAIHGPRHGTTVDEMAELIPNGMLKPIVYKTMKRREYVLIVSSIDKARYESMIGASADMPLRQRPEVARSGRRVDCSADAGEVVKPACCGERLPAGEAVIPACILCPRSPTYWRNGKG